VQEFKGMVRALHEAGIEVILDVVYNHTAEGNHLGPTLSFRGIDNAAYYRLVDDDPRYYMDYTGTGNSSTWRTRTSLQMIMDSLRYWVTEMHVDGFRFDLASALAREFYDVDRLSAFFDLSAGPDRLPGQADRRAVGRRPRRLPGRQLPAAVDGVERQVPRHRPRLLARRAGDVSASSPPAHRLGDLYEHDGGAPVAAINFVTAHDGFTLRDLVSYNEKHNEANGEDNNDGTDDNRSWNCGVEGPTDDPAIERCGRGSSATSWRRCCSRQGVPMLLHGDELGRTQDGNNNGLLPGRHGQLVPAAVQRPPRAAGIHRAALALRRDLGKRTRHRDARLQRPAPPQGRRGHPRRGPFPAGRAPRRALKPNI
jgi:isoamylase